MSLAASTRRALPALLVAMAGLFAAGGEAAGMAELPGRFEVGPSGAATYTIAIEVPPGTAGMAPQLALAYDSQRGDGLLGLGWGLSGLSVVARCPQTLAQDGVAGGLNHDAGDRFCLDGRRLVAVSGAYGADGTEYRTEVESFSRVVSYGSAGGGPAWFRVWAKDGRILDFGATADSRVEAQGKAAARFWALNRIADRAGNTLTVTWSEGPAASTALPARIDYTGNPAAGLAPYASVEFAYEARPDVRTTYEGGARVESTQRLTAVRTRLDGELVRDYRLAYGQSPLTARSRLASVTPCDGAGQCLPATRFDWTDGTATFAAATHAATAVAADIHYADIDGDGRADLVYQSGNQVHVARSTGSGFEAPRHVLTLWGVLSTIGLADVNGDGMADLVAKSTGVDYGQTGDRDWVKYSAAFTLYLSTGSGFTGPADWEILSMPDMGNAAAAQFRLGDVDGDGRADLVLFYTGYGLYASVLRSTGSQFGPPVTWSMAGHPFSLPDFQLADVDGTGRTELLYRTVDNAVWAARWTGSGISPLVKVMEHGGAFHVGQLQLADVNGDGSADLMFQGPDNRFWLSLATGAEPAGFTAPVLVVHHAGSYVRGQAQYADVDGDGRADLIFQAPNNSFWLSRSTGTAFTAPVQVLQHAGSFAAGQAQYADTDGDGRADLSFLGTDGRVWLSTTRGTSVTLPDLLASVTTGLGAITAAAYATLSETGAPYIKGTAAAYPTLTVQAPIPVVALVGNYDGHGGSRFTLFSYQALRADLHGRGFYGFHRRSTADLTSAISRDTYYRQGHPWTGLVEREIRSSMAGVLSDVTNSYGIAALGGTRYFVRLDRRVESTADLDGSPLPTVTTDHQYDAWGNRTRTDRVASDGFSRTTHTSYANDAAQWLLGLPVRVTTVSTGPDGVALTRVRSHAYHPATGLPTQTVVEPDQVGTPLRLQTYYAYDAFGNRASESNSAIGIASATTNTAWDARGRFPVQVTNPLGQVEQHAWDGRFGTAAGHTDTNGLVTTWSHDGFGRRTSEQLPDGTRTTWSYATCVAPCAGAAPYTVASERRHAGTGVQTGPSEQRHYDRLGREIESRSQRGDGVWLARRTEYDVRSRVLRISRPFVAGTAPVAWGGFEYDALDRVVAETAPNGGRTTWLHQGLRTTVTDARGQARSEERNSLGKVVRAWGPDGQLAASYSYDGHGDLVRVTDAAGNATAVEYDRRGRKTALDDPGLGRTDYGYDALDRLVWERNARGQETTYAYDRLDRLVERRAPDLVGTWTWDTAAYGVGRLARSATDGGQTREYAYDALGRPVAVTTMMAGTLWHFDASYDAQGRLARVDYPSGPAADFGLHYPSGRAVSYGYTGTGELWWVADGATGAELWRAQAWDQEGRLTHRRYGNGVVTEHGYSAETGLVTSIRARPEAGSAWTVQDLAYAWDMVGNLSARSDAVSGLQELFGYDGWQRLVRSETVGGARVDVSYDAVGNITWKSDVGSYAYPPAGTARPHAVQSITGPVTTGFGYDATGNLLWGHGRSLAWTSFDMPSTITRGVDAVSFEYDAERARLRRSGPEGETWYLSAFGVRVEHKQGALGLEQWDAYVRAGDDLVAVRHVRGDGVELDRYFHQDPLGSVVAVSDGTGAVVERSSFDAWGVRRHADGTGVPGGSVASSQTRGFTGHEHLASVDLVHMNGRVYDPVVGRFPSADPLVQAPYDPQALNRYSYVRNNPLRYTDPSGYAAMELAGISVTADRIDVGAQALGDRNGGSGDAGGGSPSSLVGGTATFSGGRVSSVSQAEFLGLFNPAYAGPPTEPDPDAAGRLAGWALNMFTPYGDLVAIYESFHARDYLGTIEYGVLAAISSGGPIGRLGSKAAKEALDLARSMVSREAWGRRGAFRAAKRDLGIPMSQQPVSVTKDAQLTTRSGRTVLGQDGKPINTREYTFERPDGTKAVIQDHGAGHKYGQGGIGDVGAHFNIRDPSAFNSRNSHIPDTRDHYFFD